MAELGKIEKPSVESFSGQKRKLYCVASVYSLEDAPDEYKALVDRYWDDVALQITKLEAAGKIMKIFCEHIHSEGEAALEALGRINQRALEMVKRKMDEGASFLPVESQELFGPFLDWTNCLHVVRTREVAEKVLGFYLEVSQKRLDYVLKVIEENLQGGQAGLLIMRDEDRAKLQFPPDFEVFLVTPPSYDDLMRWFRDKLKDVSTE